MADNRNRTNVGASIYTLVVFSLAIYFMFGAVQGNFGLFQRIQIDAEAVQLRREVTRLERQLADVSNKTHRLSDAYLDVDLLDERVRDVLGYVRPDEIVIR
ncbi:septum formation initiator precursor [Brevirhabdus pacifica]|uniref:Septum formation initiator n=2 Tax=Brevirhabdus pacifica TaxID=1267768 RepID=A0A1U7DLW6_9RHOB|nr:septum formation initiator family protein [Brevirhabdus pacifica]APX90869.1 septum formation initiator precursor [Brevirhabdus pacifica]OWU80301.1 septum formation initiator precursor [Loktanella sp. 22II-4b]PJJ87154.1 cell division protein FtsB [Brevirhabdus pacifica]